MAEMPVPDESKFPHEERLLNWRLLGVQMVDVVIHNVAVVVIADSNCRIVQSRLPHVHSADNHRRRWNHLHPLKTPAAMMRNVIGRDADSHPAFILDRFVIKFGAAKTLAPVSPCVVVVLQRFES